MAVVHSDTFVVVNTVFVAAVRSPPGCSMNVVWLAELPCISAPYANHSYQFRLTGGWTGGGGKRASISCLLVAHPPRDIIVGLSWRKGITIEKYLNLFGALGGKYLHFVSASSGCLLPRLDV